MAVYLVDFENVRSEGLKGVENLGKNEKVVIFYSKNADAITFDVHMLLSKSNAEVETYRILRGGHNSLDFQLSTYLGYLVMENCYRDIVIVSEDKGFLCVTSFWEENSELCNAKIRLCKSINMADNVANDDFEDGLTGKFIEKLSVKKASIGNTNQTRKNDLVLEGTANTKNTDNTVIQTVENNRIKNNSDHSVSNDISKHKGLKKSCVNKEHKKSIINHKLTKKCSTMNEDVKNDCIAETAKTVVENQNLKVNQPITSNAKENKITQNPTSKNKIFTAEVKFNITEDVKSIINGKIDEKQIPLLVETIGKSTGKQHFYKMVVSKFGQELGREIYLLIKGQYANLKRK